MAVDRRNPHRSFEPPLIEEFLQGRGISTIELLPAGKSNTNYKLLLSDGERCVLRLYSRGDAQREVYVMGLARDLVPVPQELHRGENWSVFTLMNGELLKTVPQHSGPAAEALARISSITFQAPGWIIADGSVSPFSFGGVREFISASLDKAEVRSCIGREAVGRIEQIVKAESGRLEELESECRLVHGDFNPTNILISDGAVSGVLDWEYCHSGTPYMDIGNLLRHTPAECHGEIKAGLEAGGMRLPSDWRERAGLVDLTSQLEFLTSRRSDGFKQQCAATVYGFIEKFGGGAVGRE